MGVSPLKVPDEWLPNRALNPTCKSRDHLTSHQSPFWYGYWTLLHSLFCVSLPYQVWNLSWEFVYTFTLRVVVLTLEAFVSLVMQGMSVNHNKLQREEKYVSLSAFFWTVHINYQQMALPSRCHQEADYAFVKYFKMEYKPMHINAIWHKLTLIPSFYTCIKASVLRMPICVCWELLATMCREVAGSFQAWECNAWCQHD